MMRSAMPSEPDDAVGVVIPIAVGVLHRDLGLAQAAEARVSRRLGDGGAALGVELLPHRFQGRLPADELTPDCAVRDKKRPAGADRSRRQPRPAYQGWDRWGSR
jgi:hypothetical protein